ncbi:MAG: ABC transporter permease [Planctomycetes bacterium]|nr:ABC transporter permease [Planctomycetota bacterium]
MAALWRIRALVIKEFLAVLRDPRSRFVVLVPPLIQFLVFGYAATFEVSGVRLAVLDHSRSDASRRLIARVAASESFRLIRTIDSADLIPALVDRGEARVVLVIDESYARDLEAGLSARVQVLADGRNSNVAAIAIGYLSEIVAREAAALRPEARRVELVERAWFNENLSSRWYVVGALPATIVMVVVMLLSALTIAREREFGSFDQLLVTPMSSTEILIGKAIPGIVFGMAIAAALLIGGIYWFGVPFRGQVGTVFLTLFLFSLAIVGIGLFVSSLARTMQQGLLGAFVVIMPTVILSGFTTPIGNMPGWLQRGTLANPLRWAVADLRAILLEGAGLREIAGSIPPLLAIAAVTLSAAAWMFRRRSS